jgi:hypothetical protein
MDRESFFNLSYVNFPRDLKPEDHPDEVALAIFQTNAVAAGDGVGIFPGMARLNHGCSRAFNVVYTWRPQEQALVVHALRTIQKGQVSGFSLAVIDACRSDGLMQELLTTYTNTKRPRDQRRCVTSDRVLCRSIYERIGSSFHRITDFIVLVMFARSLMPHHLSQTNG